MSDKQYRSIFVKTETKDKIKIQATKLNFPSMVDYLEKLSNTPLNRLEELRNK